MMLSHLQPPCTDHFQIMTTLNTSMAQTPDLPKVNWQQVNWGNFREHLISRLNELPTPMEIQTLEEFNTRLNSLTTAINTVIAAIVPCTKPSPFTKARSYGPCNTLFDCVPGRGRLTVFSDNVPRR